MKGPSDSAEAQPSLPPGMSLPEVQDTLRREGYGDEEPKSEGERFISECLDWVSNWFRHHTSDAGLSAVEPFLLLFDPTRETGAVFDAGTPLPSFRNDLNLQIGGRVYAAAVNLRQVYAIASDCHTCPELLGFIQAKQLGHTFAVAVSPVNRSAMIHSGSDLDAAQFVSFKRVGSAEFDFSKLDSFLEIFYNEYVATHEGFCDVWSKATKRQLKVKPERQIQRSLHGFFRHGVLPDSAIADREIQTYAGRSDLRIIRAREDRSLEGAVMELKVLFPNKSETDNLEWAKQGVDQVVGYAAADTKVLVRYVCCYDGRKDDTAMPDGASYASEHAVTWRRYFMQTPGVERKLVGFDS